MNPTENPINAIAQDLVALCREERYSDVYDKYFTENTRAVEPFSFDGGDTVTVGKDAIKAKAEKWASYTETIKLNVSEPSVVNGNQFIVWMEITSKNGDKDPETHSEYVLYTVEDEKIIEEKFFYCP